MVVLATLRRSGVAGEGLEVFLGSAGKPSLTAGRALKRGDQPWRPIASFVYIGTPCVAFVSVFARVEKLEGMAQRLVLSPLVHRE